MWEWIQRCLNPQWFCIFWLLKFSINFCWLAMEVPQRIPWVLWSYLHFSIAIQLVLGDQNKSSQPVEQSSSLPVGWGTWGAPNGQVAVWMKTLVYIQNELFFSQNQYRSLVQGWEATICKKVIRCNHERSHSLIHPLMPEPCMLTIDERAPNIGYWCTGYSKCCKAKPHAFRILSFRALSPSFQWVILSFYWASCFWVMGNVAR